jgi:hypothetical protein
MAEAFSDKRIIEEAEPIEPCGMHIDAGRPVVLSYNPCVEVSPDYTKVEIDMSDSGVGDGMVITFDESDGE